MTDGLKAAVSQTTRGTSRHETTLLYLTRTEARCDTAAEDGRQLVRLGWLGAIFEVFDLLFIFQ